MTYISGSLRYHMPVRCSRCEREFLSGHRLEITGPVTLSEVGRSVLADFRQRAPNLPVGWAMYGRGDVRCPEHSG